MLHYSPLPDSSEHCFSRFRIVSGHQIADSFFSYRNRLLWQGKNLDSGKGLYTVSIDRNGRVQGSPAVVDTGNDSQAGWTYEDPNTSFLF